MTYPPIDQAQSTKDFRQLLEWQLFLPSPDSEEKVNTLNIILQRVAALREIRPDDYVKYHKELVY